MKPFSVPIRLIPTGQYFLVVPILKLITFLGVRKYGLVTISKNTDLVGGSTKLPIISKKNSKRKDNPSQLATWQAYL